MAALAPRYRWLLAAAVLLLLSTALVLWADTRPGYDPYGWLVWGKLTIHGNLDTNGAPSWKPLPFLVTVPFALLGHYALWLWMILAVAVSLSGLVFAWRIAVHLTDAPPGRRWAGLAAGAFAAIALLGIRDYTHFTLSAQSDTMIVSLCLAAIDCQLAGRYRWAFWLWILGALGRPEVWPFLALYTVWAWRTLPTMRRMLAAGVMLIPLLWFGIPALTAKSAFIAGNNALHSPRQLHSNKLLGTLDRFLDLHELAVWVAGLAAVAIAALRRQRFILLLAAGAVVWVVVEVAFVLHGYPGVQRYLFEPVAIVCVLAGVFVGRVLLDVTPLLGRLGPRFSPRYGAAVAGVILFVLAASLVPAARSRVRIERADLTHERARTRELNALHTVVTRIGLKRLLACGRPNIQIGNQSVFAWYTGIKIGALYISKKHELEHPSPLVNIYPLKGGGWKVFPSHLAGEAVTRCHGLRLTIRS
ncbi:MAG: hypothetical protein ACR2JH_08780 [Solirubrobacteraceae bacterium]